MKKKLATRDRTVVLPVPIAQWPRNSGQVVRLRVESYRGRYRANLRIWFFDDGGELRRTRRGVPIPLEQRVSIRTGLGKAEEAAIEPKLIGLPVTRPRGVRSSEDP
jgi:hypothetical protein